MLDQEETEKDRQQPKRLLSLPDMTPRSTLEAPTVRWHVLASTKALIFGDVEASLDLVA